MRLLFRHAGSILADDVHHGRPVALNRLLQALVAGYKAYSTWEAVSTLQVCRECTGGMVSARPQATGHRPAYNVYILHRDHSFVVVFTS